MAEITLKDAMKFGLHCPICGAPETQSPVQYPNAQTQAGDWIKCNACGTLYNRTWRAAGGGGCGI